MSYIVGVDIGGTNTAIGIFNKKGDLLIQTSIKTNVTNGPEKTFHRIWKTIKFLANNIQINPSEISAIGMGIPGPVVNNSIIRITSNFCWGNNFNAKQLMEKISNTSVKIENDVKLIALGEAQFGVSKNYSNSITIPIGTGIAAGIIINGKLVEGFNGYAGELGHINVEENGHQCGCGLKGCLETYCSGKGIVREAKKRLKYNSQNLLYKKINGNLDILEAKDIFETATQGDFFSIQIVNFFCKYLAKSIGILLNILNPEIIVITGGLSNADNILKKLLIPHLNKYALKITLENIKITFSELKETAGLFGAIALVLNK